MIKQFLITALLGSLSVTAVKAQQDITIDDFESGNKGWSLVDPGWLTLEITANPSPDEINGSANVVRCVRKTNSNTWAGAILRGKFEVPIGAGVGEYRYAHIKVLKSSSGNVGFKLESGPGNKTFGVNTEYIPTGKWVDVVLDMGAATPGTYKDFFFMVDQTENPKEDIEVFIDDIVLKTDPNATDDEDDTPGEYTVVWQDEFDETTLDATKWSYELGTGDWGWGNNEKQYYTDRAENVFIRDGSLVIKAIKESYKGSDYTSGRILTRGKASWLYGKIEARLKLPKGRGTWPAFWMMPAKSVYGGWPKSGELDIMEYVGYQPGTTHGTVHTQAGSGGSASGASVYHNGVEDDFHIIGIEWTPKYIRWYYDDEPYFKTYRNLAGWDWNYWPFDQEFYIILNHAVGGNWGGAQGIDNSIFPQEYQIDYIKVYQKRVSGIGQQSSPKNECIVTINKGTLQVYNSQDIQQITIYNTNGSAVFGKKGLGNHETIDMTAQADGLYIVSVETDGKTITRKIVK